MAMRELLPGENPDSHDVRDALRWIEAYREIQQLLDDQLIGPARGLDRKAVETHSRRVGARLAYWKSRRQSLLARNSWTPPAS